MAERRCMEQAPWYRSQSGLEYIMTDTDTGIEDLKRLMVNGNLGIIPVYCEYYSNFGAKNLWTLDNYNPSLTDHANTVVGYDDNYGPYTESGNSNKYGAFKVANSWGPGFGTDGFYYISYECLKQRVRQVYFYENYVDYVPKMVAVFEINSCFRHDNLITFGLGNPSTPTIVKGPPGISVSGGNYPYPNNPMVVDITEFIPYMSESTNRFFMSVHKLYGSSTAVLQSFSIKMYDDYASGMPKNVYVSTETPVNGPNRIK